MKPYFLFILLFIAGLSSGCASYTLDKAQNSLRDNYSSADYHASAELLEKLEKDNVYKSKDAVLLHLEKGMVTHFSGDYEKSNQFLDTVEKEIEANFTKSVSRGFQSMLVSDNALVYDGEDYEDVYLNVFKALNYIHLNDYDAALVEARRIAFKLEGIEVRNRGLAETISRTDSLQYAEWKTGDRVIENSALGHYLSAVLFAKTNRPDNARIEVDRLYRAIEDQKSAYNFQSPPKDDIEKLKDQNAYNVLITGFSGRAPIKTQHDFRLFLEKPAGYFKFSVPSLELYHSAVNRVDVVVDDSTRYPTYIIEEMDKVAQDVYQVKEPIIYARALTRSVLKTAGVNRISNHISEKNESLGILSWLLGIAGQEISEKADLRSWQTLPGKAHVNTIQLPPGNHTIILEYYSSAGRLLYSEEQTIEVFEGNDLALIEALYWH